LTNKTKCFTFKENNRKGGELMDICIIIILGFMAAMGVTCFLWGYVLGMAAVEIEEEESHTGGVDTYA
jgi:TctA family transporter